MFLCTPARTIWVASVLGASGMSATGAMTCRRPGSSRISSGTEIGPTRLLREALVTEPSPIKSLKALRTAEEACTRCPLYKDASQLVPGEGPARAHLMMVGEHSLATRKTSKADRSSAPRVVFWQRPSPTPDRL